jgi:hypothetical protein
VENEAQEVVENEQQQPVVSDEDRMAAFEAGLSGKRSTATPTEQDERQPETEAEAPAPPAAPEPRYRQITEDEFRELTARAAKVDDLEQTHKRDRDAIYGSIGALKQSLNARQAISLPKEKLDALRSDIPEVADLFDAVAQATAAPTVDTEALLKAAEDRLKPAIEKAREEAKATAWTAVVNDRREQMEEWHPGWQTIVGSAEFAEHVRAKGEDYFSKVIKAGDEWNHRFMRDVIKDFKDAKKKADDKASARRERLESNVNPRGTAAPSEAPPTREEAFNAGLRKVGAVR